MLETSGNCFQVNLGISSMFQGVPLKHSDKMCNSCPFSLSRSGGHGFFPWPAPSILGCSSQLVEGNMFRTPSFCLAMFRLQTLTYSIHRYHRFPANFTQTQGIFETTWSCAGAASGTGPATAGDLDLEGFRASRPATKGRHENQC